MTKTTETIKILKTEIKELKNELKDLKADLPYSINKIEDMEKIAEKNKELKTKITELESITII